ncbi:MAG: hypothetical protein LUH40_08150 [Clostridiales bacterium]|nr:hypothetical protein [Clostridiales bacterium]
MSNENMDELFAQIKNNSKEDNKKIAEQVMKSLSPEQSQTLKSVLSDKSLMDKILNSKEARDIMGKIGGANGHK